MSLRKRFCVSCIYYSSRSVLCVSYVSGWARCHRVWVWELQGASPQCPEATETQELKAERWRRFQTGEVMCSIQSCYCFSGQKVIEVHLLYNNNNHLHMASLCFCGFSHSMSGQCLPFKEVNMTPLLQLYCVYTINAERLVHTLIYSFIYYSHHTVLNGCLFQRRYMWWTPVKMFCIHLYCHLLVCQRYCSALNSHWLWCTVCASIHRRWISLSVCLKVFLLSRVNLEAHISFHFFISSLTSSCLFMDACLCVCV